MFIRRVRERQAEAVELFEIVGNDPPWPSVQVPYSDDPEALARAARAALSVNLAVQKAWHRSRGYTIYTPLREWVDAVERLGVLVMQTGVVPTEVMRGFAATHETVPAVIVNTNDDARARAFTLLHEFGHLLRMRAGRACRSARLWPSVRECHEGRSRPHGVTVN